jgi:hypothetical protein
MILMRIKVVLGVSCVAAGLCCMSQAQITATLNNFQIITGGGVGDYPPIQTIPPSAEYSISLTHSSSATGWSDVENSVMSDNATLSPSILGDQLAYSFNLCPLPN